MKKLFMFAILSSFVLAGCTNTPEVIESVPTAKPTEVIYKSTNPNMNTPAMTIDQTKTYSAKFVTNYGEFVIELDAANKPITVNSFVNLSTTGFYDGVIFHRIIKDFMIQGGDPDGLGTGGPGYSFKDEIGDSNVNAKGTISMANSGPNTNGSQFFINTADNNFLDKKHTVFGKVVEGMDVVEKIGSVEVEANMFGSEMSSPVEPVVIETIEITTK